MKRCKECLHWKPADKDHFRSHDSTADRLRGICRVCEANKQDGYRQKRMAAHLAYNREYRRLPEVRERRNDHDRLVRAMKRRLARKDGSSL